MTERSPHAPEPDEQLEDQPAKQIPKSPTEAYMAQLKGISNLADITKNISNSLIESPQLNSLKSTIENMTKYGTDIDGTLSRATDRFRDEHEQRMQEQHEWLNSLEFDTSHQDTAQNTAQMAEATLQLVSLTDTLAKLTQTNLEQARRSEQRSLEAERRSTRIAWVSAGGSIVAVLIAAATLATTIFLR